MCPRAPGCLAAPPSQSEHFTAGHWCHSPGLFHPSAPPAYVHSPELGVGEGCVCPMVGGAEWMEGLACREISEPVNGARFPVTHSVRRMGRR